MSRQDSRKIENVKVVLVKGESGNDGSSIESIEKTGTSGVVDTYTITLTDGSKTTFEVRNGSNISNIEKTGTSGLVDTYTVTLTDGSTTTFQVTNGRNGEDATTQSLAYVNEGNTAGKNFVRGDLLVLDGLLYQTITAISSGTTLEEGTNIARTKVSDLVYVFGICDTAAGSASKDVKLTNAPNNFSLYDGLRIRVKFTNGHIFGSNTLYLNVNGTGSKPVIIRWGRASIGDPSFNICGEEIVEFIFEMNSYNRDGSWIMQPTLRMLEQIARTISPSERNWGEASRAYAVGEYVRNIADDVYSTLYRVINAVAEGGSLVDNVERTTVGDELKALNTWEKVNVTVDNTKITSGTVWVYKKAGLCHVFFNGLTFAQSANSQLGLVTGLPEAITQGQCSFAGSNAEETVYVFKDAAWIQAGSTALSFHAKENTRLHFGSFSYPCE
jgi:hypothetical protein